MLIFVAGSFKAAILISDNGMVLHGFSAPCAPRFRFIQVLIFGDLESQ